MPAAPVSPKYLLEGAAYALEQCGLLLRDADLLYRNGSYANAVALAALAREELGQWKILRNLRTEVLAGKRLTITDIQDACGDHESKQRAGALSATMQADRNSQLGRLLQTWTAAARKQLEELRRRKGKGIPSKRHKQRMSALYVDPVPGGWNRPIEKITQAIAYDYLQEALNDYRGPYDRYTDPQNHKPDAFYSALEQWTGRPTLPRP